MKKKDVLELKRRFKKNECTFTRMCGCYVDGQKNIVLKIGETFLNLKDEEFYKYLEIAKKALSEQSAIISLHWNSHLQKKMLVENNSF